VLKRVAWLLGIVVFVIVGVVVDSLRRAGELATLTPRPLACRSISGVIGPEDITFDRKRRVAYISGADVRALMNGRPATGALYRYAPGDGSATTIYTRPQNDFHAHGISFLSDGQGPDLLYVVNHPSNAEHTIEVFEIDDSGARLVQTIRDPHLISPNDVIAVSRTELYFTNDHGVPRGPKQLTDDLLRRARAEIVHVKNGTFSVLADDLAYANGINVSADGSELYLSEASGRRLRIYARTPSTGAIQLKRTIELDQGPDNIELGPDGSVYVAGHPKLMTFLRHAKNPSVLAPSEVVRIHPKTFEVERLYLDLGSQLSASTVAAPFDDHVLVGAVFGDHFLDCKLP
jgi:arylesterase/paraoxonase